MCCRSGVKNAGADIGNVYLVGSKLQFIHELYSLASSALDGEGDYTAGSVGEILLGTVVVLICLKTGVGNGYHLVTALEELSHLHCVGAVNGHTYSQCFKSQIEQER